MNEGQGTIYGVPIGILEPRDPKERMLDRARRRGEVPSSSLRRNSGPIVTMYDEDGGWDEK